jgi:TolB protein
MLRKDHNYLLQILIILLCVTTTTLAKAQNIIDINIANEEAIKIAIIPFYTEGQTAADSNKPNVQGIITNNLTITGQFEILPVDKMISFPSKPEQVVFSDWQSLDVRFIILASLSLQPDLKGDIYVMDVLKQKTILQQSIAASTLTRHKQIDILTNKIYETLTGIPGVFADSLVCVSYNPHTKKYSLNTTNIHGFERQTIFTSSSPIMSPSWSRQLNILAFASFIDRYPQIYLYELKTKKLVQITNAKSLHSSPVWANTANKLAYVSSISGNADIYVFDFVSKQHHRITRNKAIDTEPAWSSDDTKLAFTSNRAGKYSQIYEYNFGNKQVKPLFVNTKSYANAQYAAQDNLVIAISSASYTSNLVVYNKNNNTLQNMQQSYLLDSLSISNNGYQLAYTRKNLLGKNEVVISDLKGKVHFTLPIADVDIVYVSWI